jgi:hypothetical protein
MYTFSNSDFTNDLLDASILKSPKFWTQFFGDFHGSVEFAIDEVRVLPGLVAFCHISD